MTKTFFLFLAIFPLYSYAMKKPSNPLPIRKAHSCSKRETYFIVRDAINELLEQKLLIFSSQYECQDFIDTMLYDITEFTLMRLTKEVTEISKSHDSFFTRQQNLKNYLLSKRISFGTDIEQSPNDTCTLKIEPNSKTDELQFEMD